MPERIEGLSWQCEKNHQVVSSFNEDGLADLRRSLADGRVLLFCFRCGRDYRVSQEAQATIRVWLDDIDQRVSRIAEDVRQRNEEARVAKRIDAVIFTILGLLMVVLVWETLSLLLHH
jgi:hypothetical protein